LISRRPAVPAAAVAAAVRRVIKTVIVTMRVMAMARGGRVRHRRNDDV